MGKMVQGHRFISYGDVKWLHKIGLRFPSVFIYELQEKIGNAYTGEKPTEL